MSERGFVLESVGASYKVGGSVLVDRVDIAIAPGEFVGVLGPNGAGKSTLLRMLAGEIRPTGGMILLDGHDLRTKSAAELAQRRAVVPQATALTFPFTAREVVLLGASVPSMGVDPPRWRVAAAEAIAAVGMSQFAERLFVELSGGERQRVHIARALCQLAAARHRPRESAALLLDEPTASLDLAHQRLVLGAVRRVAEQGTAVLGVLHDFNLAAAYCDRLVLLHRGRVAIAGAAREVLSDEMLSTVYGCEIRANTLPANDIPFVLPVTSMRDLASDASTAWSDHLT